MNTQISNDLDLCHFVWQRKEDAPIQSGLKSLRRKAKSWYVILLKFKLFQGQLLIKGRFRSFQYQ